MSEHFLLKLIDRPVESISVLDYFRSFAINKYGFKGKLSLHIIIMYFENSIFDSNSSLSILQKIFKYAPPIFVGIETIQLCQVNCSQTWLHVLRTTRILMAHCSIADNQRDIYLRTIANNIRNLYRLFDIDLATKDGWRDVTDDMCHYVLPNEDNITWVSLNDTTRVALNFQSISFVDMKAEFDEDVNSAHHAFGSCVYNLVATRDNLWMTSFPKHLRTLTN